jgi:hypothetical protein
MCFCTTRRVHALKLLCDLRLEKDDLREAVDSALAPSNTRGRPSQSQSAAPAGRLGMNDDQHTTDADYQFQRCMVLNIACLTAACTR